MKKHCIQHLWGYKLVIALLLLLTLAPVQADQTSTYAYNALGLIESFDGARTDVSDITLFTYDNQGNLTHITNALGQVTQITAHDLSGRPLTIVDANGAISQLNYDERGRLSSQDTAGRVTDFNYDQAGNLVQVSLPNAQVITYSYDAANRPTGYSDAQGNRIVYTLDNAGNQTQVNVSDPNQQLTRSHQYIYDELSRLRADVGAQGQTESLQYDTNNNLTDKTDPNLNPTQFAFDALNRLTETTDAGNGQTSYTYDTQGNLISVTDPNGQITNYSYDSFDNLIQQNSPDTGITSYTYDDAGNRISQTNANGITTRYSYDALNRLIEIDYPNAKLNINFTYDENDSAQNGVGRLTSQTDASGTTKYTYDLRGNVLTQTSIRSSITLTMGYAYNNADQLVQATYPDGRRFDYQYDVSGNVSDITTDYQGSVQPVLSNIQYQPFGPVMGMTYGNGLTLGQIYDLDTRLTQSTTPSMLERGYGFDDASNISSITNDLDPSATESFDYDNLNRLETAGGSYGSLGYSYDPTHNRTQKTDSIQGDTYYDYDLNNNHLTAVTAGDTKNYQYDAVGNIVDNNSYRFDYADNNRLAAVKVGNKKIATYKYNGQGQRAEKIIGKATTHYLYGLQGELLAEIETTRKSQGVLRNYLYLNGRPITITEANSLYYIHSDHLGTPQIITDQNQANVWRASYSPFGQALITTEVIVNNVRFPGQYYDQESNLHYNWNRYYNPETGRYLTSDPTGISDGPNGYIYTHANPVTNFDYDGFRARKSGGHNSRIQRKAQAIRSRAQSLTQRLKNLQNKQEGREQVIKDLVDGLDNLKEMLDKLNDPYLPMKCIKFVCPWDQKNTCFAAPQMSPIRAPENGCKCDKFVLVP